MICSRGMESVPTAAGFEEVATEMCGEGSAACTWDAGMMHTHAEKRRAMRRMVTSLQRTEVGEG